MRTTGHNPNFRQQNGKHQQGPVTVRADS